MRTVTQILRDKGGEVWSVSPDDSVYRALEVMADKGVGALVVLEGDRLAGIVSERDYARKVVLLGKSSFDASVEEIMTSEVTTVAGTDDVDACMDLMTERRIRHLPVVEEDRVVGVISIGDVVRAVISDRESMIEQLERYITSS